MPDSGSACEVVHIATQSGELVCSHQRRMVHAGLMEKIMSETEHNTEVCELTESALDKVNGGIDPISAWYQAMGRVGLPLPNQGNPVTDSLHCQTT
jgi:hypothetical protein